MQRRSAVRITDQFELEIDIEIARGFKLMTHGTDAWRMKPRDHDHLKCGGRILACSEYTERSMYNVQFQVTMAKTENTLAPALSLKSRRSDV